MGFSDKNDAIKKIIYHLEIDLAERILVREKYKNAHKKVHPCTKFCAHRLFDFFLNKSGSWKIKIIDQALNFRKLFLVCSLTSNSFFFTQRTSLIRPFAALSKGCCPLKELWRFAHKTLRMRISWTIRVYYAKVC